MGIGFGKWCFYKKVSLPVEFPRCHSGGFVLLNLKDVCVPGPGIVLSP